MRILSRSRLGPEAPEPPRTSAHPADFAVEAACPTRLRLALLGHSRFGLNDLLVQVPRQFAYVFQHAPGISEPSAT